MSLIKVDNKTSLPIIGNTNDNLNIVRSGNIEYSCRSVNLDATTYTTHFLELIIPHGYVGLTNSLGLAVIVNRADPITGTVGSESVSAYSNIVPWDGGGLYYYDGTNTVYYSKYVYVNNANITLQMTKVCYSGSYTVGSFSNAHLNWLLLNSKDEITTADGTGGGIGTGSGKKYYYDIVTYDSNMELYSTISSEGEFTGNFWKTPFIPITWLQPT